MRVLLSLLLFSALAFGQFAQRVRFVATDPSGACGPGYIAQNIVTGNLMGCVGGVWASLTGGAGAPGTVTSVGLVGTANQLTVTGASPITASGSWTISIPSALTLPGTINKLTLTAPATGATLTIPDGVSFTGPPASGTAVTLAGTETLSGKTLTTPTISATGFANANHAHAAANSGGQLAEGALALTDVTTNNASTSAHGFAPKGTVGTTQYWRQDWTLGTPAGGGGSGCVPAGTSGQILTDDGAGGCTAITTSGTGNGIKQTSPTLVTPALGTPTSVVLTNATGTAAALTAGAATVLATTRAIYGNNFDGSAAITGPVGIAFGGTGTASTLTGLVRGSASAMTAAELSGDATTSGSNAVTIAAGAVSLAKMANIATATLIGRTTAGTGVPEALTVLPAALEPAHTGDVTNTAGSLALTIGPAKVLASMLVNSGVHTGDATGTFPAVTVTKINGTALSGLATGILKNTTSTGVPSIAVAGDFPTLNQNTTGSAATITGAIVEANTPMTTKGDLLVEDGTTLHRLAVGSNGQVLTADSAQTDGVKWASVTGTGDFVGPASSTDNAFVRFDGTTGKLGQNSTSATLDDTGNAAFASVATGDGTVAGGVSLFELTSNGTNFRRFLVPDALTANLTMTFPNTVPAAGDVLTFGAPSSDISTMAFKGVASANTASAIVARDGSGNFTAGTITANLTGNASGTAATITGSIVEANTPLTTKGDLLVEDGTTLHRLAVGTDGQVLTADAASTDGVKWAAASGGGAPTDATYITQTANGSLSAEQALGALATGCLGSATTTGVVSSRTITGTANQITVANGDCTGNPTLSIPTSPAFTTPAITGLATGSGVATANTVSTLVARDGSGNFSAGTITAALTGNASTATALAANPADCSSNQFANAIAASGDLACAALTLAGAQFANQGTTTTLLHGNASGNPSWSAVSLTADVTGVLPTANIAVALTNQTSINGITIPSAVGSATAAQVICSGTAALGTSAIASGAAATTVTATCTGLASTDNISMDFNGSPLGVTGYVPSANGMLGIIKWPTTNTINVSVVNNTAASITPGAITLNYRVTR